MRKLFKVTSREAGSRLDIWLSKHLPELSRSRIQSLIKSGNVTVNGQQTRAHRKVTEGMEAEIEIPPVASTELVGENIPLNVLYEDADIIVVNKPAGFVVHPAAGHMAGTLVNALLYHCDDLAGIGGELRPGIVHRLDKDTSGALVAVKNEMAFAELASQFKSGQVHKEYLALVYGIPSPTTGRIETLIGRSKHDRKKMSASPAMPCRHGVGHPGRLAITHYKVEETFAEVCSMVRLRIKTGRTHQIRVHMAYIGHPVVGDTQYGRKRIATSAFRPSGRLPAACSRKRVTRRSDAADCGMERAGRQMLHAEFLAFRHPRKGKRMEFRAPLPEDMKDLLRELKVRSRRSKELETES